jgi:hypothetical protein
MMSEMKGESKGSQPSQLVPWRWPLSVATLAVAVWFVYEVLGPGDAGAMKKQSFGLLLIVGTLAVLGWVMGSPKK